MTRLDPPTGLGWLVYKTLHGGDAVSEETLAAGWRALSEARRAPYEAAGAAVDRDTRRDEVLAGDVYERPDTERNLVDRNTILVVTSAGDVDHGGTCRAQPYMRMPFDSYYSRSCLGRRIARNTEGVE